MHAYIRSSARERENGNFLLECFFVICAHDELLARLLACVRIFRVKQQRISTLKAKTIMESHIKLNAKQIEEKRQIQYVEHVTNNLPYELSCLALFLNVYAWCAWTVRFPNIAAFKNGNFFDIFNNNCIATSFYGFSIMLVCDAFYFFRIFITFDSV